MGHVIFSRGQMRTIPELVQPPPNFRSTSVGGHLTGDVIFNVQQALYMADLQWNRVSNLEPYGPEAVVIPGGGGYRATASPKPSQNS
ncbi:hypothetical protein AVEN_18086-1 [Araneus ventricosus]|uniref:Uncharacterized protein n=1 Tax=Araneus ventricosus TaxID=182803 RepID=A0A4Y2R373_ARAVE|nr:hypothetical protein AVEN_18086-1 [Araneus ventricosus]